MKVKLGQQENQLNELHEDQTKAKYNKLWKETSEALMLTFSDYNNLHKEKVKVEKVPQKLQKHRDECPQFGIFEEEDT